MKILAISLVQSKKNLILYQILMHGLHFDVCVCGSLSLINLRAHAVHPSHMVCFFFAILMVHILSFYMSKSHHFTELCKNEVKVLLLNRFVYW